MQSPPHPPVVREFLNQAFHAAHEWFDADGNWITKEAPPFWGRDRIWLCAGLYHLDPAFCDPIVYRHETGICGKHRYSVFTSNLGICLLAQHREKMSARTRRELEALGRESFHFLPGSRQPDYQFHGFNDNMPAMATMGLVLGGELLDHRGAFEYGLWNLRQLRAMLVRRGTISEYNSATYYSIVIQSMAAIVAYARDPEARRIARGIEARLWIEFAARFHPEMGLCSGPYSRAYTPDFVGHSSMATMLLWAALGDAVHVEPSPMEMFTRPPGHFQTSQDNYPYAISKVCFFAATPYHIPTEALRLFRQKPYPFRAVATAETGGGGEYYPSRPSRIETVLYPDFTLGTSDTGMIAGQQSTPYFVTYRRTRNVRSIEDVGTVFDLTMINDEEPGQGVTFPGYRNRGENGIFHDHGFKVTLQSEATALVLVHPDLSLAGTDRKRHWTEIKPTPITSLSEMVVFPSHFHGADEIRVGGKARRTWTGAVRHGEWIACRRGRLLIGIRPMAYSLKTGPVRISLEKINNYEVIRFRFYQGRKRIFTVEELRHLFGGFVAEHAGVDEFPSLSAFAKELARAKFTDYFWWTRRVRYRRPAGAARKALELEMAWHPGSPSARYATIDGRCAEWPVLKVDTVNAKQLPFLNEPFRPVPPFFPWKNFRVAWGDWPYAIHDREQ